MDKMMLYGGVVLIVVALIVGSVQLLHIYNIYGVSANKWYFYGSVGAIGLIGIVLAAWSCFGKKAVSQKPAQ